MFLNIIKPITNQLLLTYDVPPANVLRLKLVLQQFSSSRLLVQTPPVFESMSFR
jgi:hypothetical protein